MTTILSLRTKYYTHNISKKLKVYVTNSLKIESNVFFLVIRIDLTKPMNSFTLIDSQKYLESNVCKKSARLLFDNLFDFTVYSAI